METIADAKSGENLIVYCDYGYSNHISSTVQWTKDGKPIEESNVRYQIKRVDAKKYTLTLPEAGISDIGQFTVKAANDSGEVSATFSLNVITEADV